MSKPVDDSTSLTAMNGAHLDSAVARQKSSGRAQASKVQMTKAANYAAEAIRRRILEGLLSPGQRLIEADLMEELDVGRSTIREAFLRLEADGMVELRHQRGAVVRRLSRRDIAELFEIRERLEGLGAALCATRVVNDQQLREKLLHMRDVWQDGKMRDNTLHHMHENVGFHHELIELSGNRRLLKILEPLQIPGYRMQYIRLMDEEYLAQSATEHIAIVEAVLAGNQVLAEQLMRDHVRRAGALAQTIASLVD